MTRLFLIMGSMLLACGCEWDFERMIDQRRYDPFDPNEYFDNGSTMRHPPPGTVPWASEVPPRAISEGMQNDLLVTEIPVLVTNELMQRGRNRFEIFCAPCHGVLGDSDTFVARNMTLRPPPSLHEPRLRAYSPGRIYRVIAQGFGLMPSYAARLAIADRWAVVAYVQALQLSQYAELDDLPDDLRGEWRREAGGLLQ